MASSSSSSIMTSVGFSACSYDVFLSFRGEDTRHSFTDHLYDALNRAGIGTFRDNEEIRRGEELKPEIENAIKESRASIVVISKNYATSTWCLDELLLILERRRECDHFVLPVFYHVDPADLKKQRNTFAIKVKDSSRWTDHNVNLWKNALEEVAILAGMVLSGSETTFLKKIVDTIYKKLDRQEVFLPINLTGMANRYKDIDSMLRGSNAEFLAICGMGGSGKTTLARYIVNSNCQNFENISILEDISSRCKESHDLLPLQEKLLRDISRGKKRIIPSVSQATVTIEKALEVKKALIVLDDIVESSQLVKLLGSGCINKQSKIIITTRETNIGKWFERGSWRCQEYQMKLLDENEALELLSRHAFGSENLKEGYEELAKCVLRYCEGNPLALEVLGSSLAENNSIVFWESTLNLLRRDIHVGIQRVLIRSYNSLPHDYDKELFLHIACFFVGKDKEYVEKILDCSAIRGIEILTKRCLLSVSPNKKLIMHSLLQEMGRTIVHKESPKDPAKRSRVWDNKDSYDVLRKGKGYNTMEGLTLDMKMLEEEKYVFKSSELKIDALENMDNLKFLQLNFVQFTGSYKNFSEDLRWVCWFGFHLRTLPSDLFMGNLVAMDMSYSKLEVFELPTVLHSLKVLNLKDSYYLKEIRKMSHIPHLDTLILWNCYSLARVCETIGDLTSLALLNMTGCEDAFGGRVSEQPTFSFPHSLQRLVLKDCNLECSDYFPLSFSVQPSLQYLNLGNSLFECLPSYVHLKNLRVLDLSLCSKLKFLLGLPSTLAELYVYYCYSLERITFESPQFTLQEFGYEGCINLSEVEGFIKLVPLAKVEEYELGHFKWLKEYANKEVCLVGDDELTKGRSSCLQMLYEFNIMSTSLPHIKDPNLKPMYVSESSSLYFEVPSSPKNRRLKGIDVTFKYTKITCSDDCHWAWFCKISTTNNVDLMYNPNVFGKPDSSEVCIWLSYWPIGNTLNVGDEVNVSIVVISGLEVHDCGVSLVYDDDNYQVGRENDMGWLEIVGGDLSGFQLSTGAYYLCRRDFFELMEADRPTPDWFRILVGGTVDFTDIRGWRKTGRPKQLIQSFVELRSVRCIIHGPESEEIYKIAEMSKSSYTSSVKLNNELTKKAHSLSMDAHKQNQPFITNTKKHGTSTIEEVTIFAFPGSWEVNDWYHGHLFGETNVDTNLFKSLRHIGKNKPAKVNAAFLLKFQRLLSNSNFKSEVEKTVNEGKKILFTGHSYGGAIASFATLWMLDEYVKKQGKKFPIGCVTFGSPLIGDRTMSHAVRREKWAGHFTHFVMEHDIAPRIMLAPKISIQEHLPNVLKFFEQKVNPVDHKPRKFQKLFKKSSPGKSIDQEEMIEGDEYVEFFENVMMESSTVASHVAFELMEPTNSLMEKLSIDFVKVSPYRPSGFYVFCTSPLQQFVVENPNAVVELLFYFLQLIDESQDITEFALNTLAASFSYEQVLSVDLKNLNNHLSQTPFGDLVRKSNKSQFELSTTTRYGILAAEEAENRKKENEKDIDMSMRGGPIESRTESKIIEDILDEIRKYKQSKPDYYEAFKLQEKEEDFQANMNRLELAKIFDAILEMVVGEDLPDEFERRKEWVRVGTEFRRLVEPLDIANYYRHLKGDGYIDFRPKRYKFTQRWYEHGNGMDFEVYSESNFVAKVEEIKKEVEETKKKTIAVVRDELEIVEKQVQKWRSDEKIRKRDVYWGESLLSMLQEKLG